MALITISRDEYSHGRAIADQVAARMGYGSLDAQAITRRALELRAGLPGAPAQGADERRRMQAFYRLAFYQELLRGNTVYHGQAGHLLLNDVPGVLRVRLLADQEERVREEMRREDLNYTEARAKLLRQDQERDRRIRSLCSADPRRMDRFDLILNLHNILPEQAAAIICEAARITADTPGVAEAQRLGLEELILGARVETRLLEHFGHGEVRFQREDIYVEVESLFADKDQVAERVRRLVAEVAGERTVHVQVTGASMPQGL